MSQLTAFASNSETCRWLYPGVGIYDPMTRRATTRTQAINDGACVTESREEGRELPRDWAASTTHPAGIDPDQADQELAALGYRRTSDWEPVYTRTGVRREIPTGLAATVTEK